MSLSAKPTAYTVNTGHAKCPDHLYMLDEGTGTAAVDAVGTLDLTLDSSGMWNTDGTYGDILRFVSASSQKAISGAAFSATSGICLVLIAKSASATNPGADQYGMGFGSASAGIYGGIQYNLTDGNFVGVVDTGGVTNSKTVSTDIYDAAWHILALKTNDSTGSDGVLSLSLDGAAWSANAGTGDQDLAQYTRLALGCTPQASPNGFFDGDILAAWVYVDDYSAWDDAWIASIYANPWQFLTTTVKKLKLLVHADAQSDTAIAGVVFEAPAGGDITGAKIGEFTAAAFSGTLESGKAVLLVPVADFGGSALTTSDVPVVLVRNATDSCALTTTDVSVIEV